MNEEHILENQYYVSMHYPSYHLQIYIGMRFWWDIFSQFWMSFSHPVLGIRNGCTATMTTLKGLIKLNKLIN